MINVLLYKKERLSYEKLRVPLQVQVVAPALLFAGQSTCLGVGSRSAKE